MKLRKLTAFLVSLSMIVGLVLVAPVSAEITEAAGTYYENSVLNEDFDTEESLDKLTVTNGSVNEGKLEFELSASSSLVVNESLEGDVKQHVIEFDLETEQEYDKENPNPWDASFVGLRLHGISATPDGEVKGAWIGLMKNAVVLWASFGTSRWGNLDCCKVFEFENLPDEITANMTDLSSASYKIMYEGDEVNVLIKAGEEFKSLVNFNLDENKYGIFSWSEKVVTVEGEGEEATEITEVINNSFKTITFADASSDNYFAIYTVVPESDGDNPLAPEVSEDESEEAEEDAPLEPAPEEVKVVKIDNLKILNYNGKLAIFSQIEEHKNLADAFVTSLDLLEAEDTTFTVGDVLYRVYGVDTEAVREYKVSFDNAVTSIENEQMLETEANELVEDWLALTATFVTDAEALEFAGKFSGMEDALAEADPDRYGADKLAEVSSMIEEAKAIVDGNVNYTKADLDKAFSDVTAAFGILNIVTVDGTVSYSNPLTGQLSSQEWTDIKEGATSAEGYGFSWINKLRLGFAKKNTEPYSVKVTTKIVPDNIDAEGKVYNINATFFGIRQREGDKWEELTNNTWGSDIIGTGGISLQSKGSTFNQIRLVLKAGIYSTENNADVVVVPFDMTEFIGTDKKEATFKFKDYGDLVEAYVIGTEGEYAGKEVKFASVVIYPGLKDVGTFKGCHSSGKIINHLNGHEITEFSGMAIHTMENGVIGMASRGGSNNGLPDTYVKDFEISTGICVAEMIEEEKQVLCYFDGEYEAKNPVLVIGNEGKLDVSINNATQFDLDATDFENSWIKVAGHDEYIEGTTDITNSNKISINTEYDDEIIVVNKDYGTMQGNFRGTDVLTVNYGDVSTKYLVNAVTDLEKEFGYVVVAPEEGAAFEGTMVSSAIYNSRVFRCLNVGEKVIPAISYALGDGIERFLGTDVDVIYETTNDEVISYDETSGKIEAMGAGTAKIRAIVPYVTFGGTHANCETPWINVEVVESGADYGESMTVANADLLAAVDSENATLEAKKLALDIAKDAGIDVSYENDAEAELIYAALNSAKAINDELEEDKLSNEEVVDKALSEVKAVIIVYNTINEEEATASDLQECLFGTDGIRDELELSETYVTKFGELKNSKASSAMKSLLRLAKRKGTALTADFLRTNFEKTVKAQSAVNSGGGGGGGISITTDKNENSGSFRPAVSATVPTATKADKYKLDEASVNAEIAKFTDAKDAAWASTAIAGLTKNGVVKGYEDGTIRPNETITRDEFVTLLVKAFEITTKSDAVNYYNDIPAGSWQIPYISAATDAGIVSGMEALKFGTGKEISRQDMATMIYKATVKYNVNLPLDKIVAFTDSENIAGYALEAVNRLAAAGVVSGMGDDVFAPGQVATRAQAFQMIYAIMLLVK